MTTPTPPAVSEAMREAVARAIRPIAFNTEPAAYGLSNEDDPRWKQTLTWGQRIDAYERADALIAGPIASEIARLTGERDAARETKEKERSGRRIAMARGDEWRLIAAEQTTRAEAETARLRAALEDTRAAADDLVPLFIAEGDTKGAGALQFVSGFISDRLAALTSQEKTDV